MILAKRILIGLAVFLVVVVGALLLAPVIFKDEIVANVKSALNESLEAEVDFADANVSFLRSFPDIALTVDQYHIVGIDTFAGLPLVRGEQARIDLGFWSVIAGGGNYNIDAVQLDRPDVNLLVLSSELANYLIVPEAPTAGAASAPESEALVTLDYFEINDGKLIYDDRTTETYVKLSGLNATGEGDFSASVFDVITQARADAFTLEQGGMTYLNEVKMTADGTINVDADNLRYTFTDADLTLNELALVLEGSIDLEDNDDILFDLSYTAPANDFRQLWSLIPSAYTEGFEQVQTSGTFTLNGTVNGAYNGESETYPAFTVNSEVNNGSVQYPGRPVGITGIDAALAVESPAADLDRLVVALPRFNFTLGGDPFRGSFRLATPLSDPNVDARLQGTLDLGKWASAVPLTGVSELAGRIVADITADGVRQSVLDAGRYTEVNLAGNLLISNLVYDAEDSPPVRIAQARADFSPQFVDLQQFTATLGRSDLSASGRIDNVLAYFSPDQTMRGALTIRSNYFDADEWAPTEADDTPNSPAELYAGQDTTETAKVFDRFDFDIDAEIAALDYGTYRPTDLRVVGNVKPNRLDIRTAAATLDESSFSGSGTINNLFDYTFADGVLTGNLDLRSGFFNVNNFVSEEAATPSAAATGAEAAAIPVPRNINLAVNLAADRVQYTDLTLNDVAGKVVVRDGAIVFQDGRASLLGGAMGFNGAYDTAEGEQPAFRFAYDLKNMDFSQAFSTLNTFSALAPIGKFISGNFSSELVMEGRLGADLMPELGSIDARGLLRTAQARIASFKPLQVIGNALNVKELRDNAVLRDIIAAFNVTDGKVTIDPFAFQLAGINMSLGGTHGLDTDMDYRLKAAVPRTLIEGNLVAGTALGALDKLAGQASKLGLNLSPSDTLNLNIALTGTLSNPRAGIDLLGAAGGSGPTDVAGTVADAVRDRVNQEVASRTDTLRGMAETRAQTFRDSLAAQANTQAKQLEAQAAERLKGALGIKRDSTAADSLKLPNVGRDAVEDVKKELEKFNPFKRKRTGGG